jgi:hypothetical protein
MNNSKELEVKKEDLVLVVLEGLKILLRPCLEEVVVVMVDFNLILEEMLLVKEVLVQEQDLEMGLEVREDSNSSNIKIVNKILEDRDRKHSLKKLIYPHVKTISI